MQRDEDSVWWRHASLIGWKAIMPDPSARPSRFSLKKLWVILMLAVLIADGRLLYFDGRRWTNKPLPAQDTPF